MAFRANASCTLLRMQGYNVHGEIAYADPVTVPCSIVFIEPVNQRTSIRSDLSASKGDADEIKDNGKILFSPDIGIKVDDRIDVLTYSCVVTGVQPQMTTNGIHDHDSAKLRASLND